MKDRIVCIEWDDAGFSTGYYDKDNKDIHDTIVVRTVGHLIQVNKKVIIVSTDRYRYAGQSKDERHISTIPRKMVRKVTYLGDIKERNGKE